MLIREEADFKIDDKRAFTLIDTKLFQKKKKKRKKEKKRKEKKSKVRQYGRGRRLGPACR